MHNTVRAYRVRDCKRLHHNPIDKHEKEESTRERYNYCYNYRTWNNCITHTVWTRCYTQPIFITWRLWSRLQVCFTVSLSLLTQTVTLLLHEFCLHKTQSCNVQHSLSSQLGISLLSLLQVKGQWESHLFPPVTELLERKFLLWWCCVVCTICQSVHFVKCAAQFRNCTCAICKFLTLSQP